MSYMQNKAGFGCWISPDNLVMRTCSLLSDEKIIGMKEAGVSDVSNLSHTELCKLYQANFVEVRYLPDSIMEIWGVEAAIKKSEDIWSLLAASVDTIKLGTIGYDGVATCTEITDRDNQSYMKSH